MAIAGLLLNAERGGGGSEVDAVDLPFGERHVEEADVGSVIGLRRDALVIGESLELLLGSITSAFFISRSVGLLLSPVAPGLERFADEHSAGRAGGGNQRIAFAQSIADQRAAGGTGSVTDDSGRTYTRTTAEQRAGEEWKNKTDRNVHASVLAARESLRAPA